MTRIVRRAISLERETLLPVPIHRQRTGRLTIRDSRRRRSAKDEAVSAVARAGELTRPLRVSRRTTDGPPTRIAVRRFRISSSGLHRLTAAGAAPATSNRLG